jgi:glyoxylase-like metal-dependent hydrolase (beta-lactamase superfamily II)
VTIDKESSTGPSVSRQDELTPATNHAHSPHVAMPADPLIHFPALRDDPLSTQAATRLRIGDRTLLALSDGFFQIDNNREFLGSEKHPRAAWEALRAAHGSVRMPLGCFLLPGEKITLIDTGAGPYVMGKGSLVGGNLLRQMHRVGVHPDEVDVVGLSHLHGDHTGWLMDMNGQPIFRNAQVYLGAKDWEYFIEPDELPFGISESLSFGLRQLAERGKVTLRDSDGTISPGVNCLAGPGHTPGHSLFAISDHDERALLFGDAIYCAQQLSNRDWDAVSDVDKDLARRTRETYYRDLDENGGMALGCHFPGLQSGRLLGSQWVECS